MDALSPYRVRVDAIIAHAERCVARGGSQKDECLPIEDLELLGALIDGVIGIEDVSDETFAKWDSAVGMDEIANMIIELQQDQDSATASATEAPSQSPRAKTPRKDSKPGTTLLAGASAMLGIGALAEFLKGHRVPALGAGGFDGHGLPQEHPDGLSGATTHDHLPTDGSPQDHAVGDADHFTGDTTDVSGHGLLDALRGFIDNAHAMLGAGSGAAGHIGGTDEMSRLRDGHSGTVEHSDTSSESSLDHGNDADSMQGDTLDVDFHADDGDDHDGEDVHDTDVDHYDGSDHHDGSNHAGE